MSGRARHPRASKVPTHSFDPDPAVPPDHTGRAYCRRCRCAGTVGDARHPLPGPEPTALQPMPAEVRALEARMLGESDD